MACVQSTTHRAWNARCQPKKVFNEMEHARAKKMLQTMIYSPVINNEWCFFSIEIIKLIEYIFIRFYVSGSCIEHRLIMHAQLNAKQEGSRNLLPHRESAALSQWWRFDDRDALACSMFDRSTNWCCDGGLYRHPKCTVSNLVEHLFRKGWKNCGFIVHFNGVALQ